MSAEVNNHLGSSLNMWPPGLQPQRMEAVGPGVAGDQDEFPRWSCHRWPWTTLWEQNHQLGPLPTSHQPGSFAWSFAYFCMISLVPKEASVSPCPPFCLVLRKGSPFPSSSCSTSPSPRPACVSPFLLTLNLLPDMPFLYPISAFSWFPRAWHTHTSPPPGAFHTSQLTVCFQACSPSPPLDSQTLLPPLGSVSYTDPLCTQGWASTIPSHPETPWDQTPWSPLYRWENWAFGKSRDSPARGGSFHPTNLLKCPCGIFSQPMLLFGFCFALFALIGSLKLPTVKTVNPEIYEYKMNSLLASPPYNTL